MHKAKSTAGQGILRVNIEMLGAIYSMTMSMLFSVLRLIAPSVVGFSQIVGRAFLAFVFTCLVSSFTFAQGAASDAKEGNYRLNAGDIISLFVWNEPDLNEEQILVRPDGFISVPIVGEVPAGGFSIAQVQRKVIKAFSEYLRDPPTVVISLISSQGSAIYVLGKVQRPGQFPLSGPMDVTQALALAGGLNQFAAENDIKVLRRDANGVQHAVRFRYGKVKAGDNLSSNILLRSGDVVLVP